MGKLKNRKSKGQLLIVKAIRDNHFPVSAQKLRVILEENDVEINERTFERYIRELKEDFLISYNRDKNGYEINELVNKDELTIFISLLQMSINNELALTAVKNLKGRKTYIITDNETSFKGNHHIETIINAIENTKLLKFTYYKEFNEVSKRLVFPKLLKVYQNRWYLIAEDKQNNNDVRIFGLDRIENLRHGKKQNYVSSNDYKDLFTNVIGLDLRPINKEYPHAIKIKFKANHHQKHYFKSLPFHSSQEIIEEKENYAIFGVYLFANYELKQHFFHYTPFIEVLEPKWFRDEIAKDLKSAFKIHS